MELVRNVNGEVFDAAVDLRKNSEGFGKCFGVLLSADNKKQFFTNRTWVFDGHVKTARELMRQAGTFFGGRVFTLLLEEIILAVFITWLAFNTGVVKLAAQVVVIVLNYVISKTWVFRGGVGKKLRYTRMLKQLEKRQKKWGDDNVK